MSAQPPLPPWHDVYQAAIFESDRLNVSKRVEIARQNLKDRVRQLDPQRQEERWELDKALNALRMLSLLDHTLADKTAWGQS